MNKFIMFSTNYLETMTLVSGTNLNSSTVDFLRDNRSDIGYCSWNTTTGDIIIDLGSTLPMTDFLILDHNIASGTLLYSNSLGAFTSISAITGTNSAIYINSGTTINAQYLKIQFTTITSNSGGFIGEFVATQKKFQLNLNPNGVQVVPKYTGTVNKLDSGISRLIRGDRSPLFSMSLSWENLLGDFASMTGTDLQNMTELARQQVSFLFYPNGGTSDANTLTGYPNIYSFRPQDIFKCRILQEAPYSFNNGLMMTAVALYTFEEVK